MDEEPAAADARALRLDHAEHQHRRDRRVGRAAALAQHFGPGLGRARIGGADHARGFGLGGAGDGPLAGGAGGKREGKEREARKRFSMGPAYSLPTAASTEANPSRRISASIPRTTRRAIPGPS